jgi:hypothetical protein
MEINKLNYEIYFLDYHDGTLSAEQTAELILFIEQHADLKIEFEEFEHITLTKHAISFDKSSIKKNINAVGDINEINFDDYLIEELEDSITTPNEIESFISANAFLEKDRALYQKTILKADNSIVYPNKTALKKTLLVSINYKQVISFASIAAMLIFGLFLFNQTEREYSPRNTEQLSSIVIPPIAFYNIISVKSLFIKTTPNISANSSSTSSSNTQKRKQSVIKTTKINPKRYPLEQKKLIANHNKQPSLLKKEELSIAKKESPPIKNSTLKNTQLNAHLSPKEFLTQAFREKVLNREKSRVPQKKLAPFELAEAGLKTFNKLFRSNLSIAPEYDMSGDMVAYAITSDKFSMQRNLKK